MVIRKCEKCELNYVKEGEKYCKVCQKILDGNKPTVEKAELCPSCGVRIIADGYELCSACLAEIFDTIEKLDDDSGDIMDPDITPADMEVSAIDIDDDILNDDMLDEDDEDMIPEEIKNEIILDDDDDNDEEEDLSDIL